MGIWKRPLKQRTGKVKLYWYGRTRINGKLKLKSFGLAGDITRATALADFVEWRKRVRRRGYSNRQDPTLSQFAQSYIEHQRDAEQRRAWKRDTISIKHFLSFFGSGMKLSQINVRLIDNYKLHRLKKVQRSTVNRELACLRHMLALAKLWDEHEGDNPVSKAGLWKLKNQRNRVLTLEEQRLLLPNLNVNARRVVEIILRTGMRPGEAVFLKKSSVDLDKAVIRLLAGETKEGDYKNIPLTSSAVTILREAIKDSTHEYVFSSTRGSPYVSTHSVLYIVRYTCNRLGIAHLTLHDLRHSWATRALEGKHGRQANIGAIKKVLGHKNLTTTMRYLHVDQSLREAVEIAEEWEKDEE